MFASETFADEAALVFYAIVGNSKFNLTKEVSVVAGVVEWLKLLLDYSWPVSVIASCTTLVPPIGVLSTTVQF